MTPQAVEKAVSVIDFTIGENVDTLRRRSGLTKAQLGERFGLSASAMSLKLSGQRAWSALDVHDASRLFGVTMSVITGEQPLPEPTAAATITDIARGRSRRPSRSTIDVFRDATETITNTPIDIRTRRPVTVDEEDVA